MTQVCMCCGKIYGEKCPKCGAIAQPLTLSTRERRYGCPTKRCLVNTFPPGDGGETHGVCDSCSKLDEEQQRVIVEQRLASAKQRVGLEVTNSQPQPQGPSPNYTAQDDKDVTGEQTTAERKPECERNPLCTETGAGQPASPVSGSRKTDRPYVSSRREVLRDMLLLVCYEVPQAVIDGWSNEWCWQAEKWAGRTHLRASDNYVRVPPLPTFLIDFSKPHSAVGTQHSAKQPDQEMQA
jgi:hypothetical protein